MLQLRDFRAGVYADGALSRLGNSGEYKGGDFVSIFASIEVVRGINSRCCQEVAWGRAGRQRQRAEFD